MRSSSGEGSKSACPPHDAPRRAPDLRVAALRFAALRRQVPPLGPFGTWSFSFGLQLRHLLGEWHELFDWPRVLAPPPRGVYFGATAPAFAGDAGGHLTLGRGNALFEAASHAHPPFGDDPFHIGSRSTSPALSTHAFSRRSRPWASHAFHHFPTKLSPSDPGCASHADLVGSKDLGKTWQPRWDASPAPRRPQTSWRSSISMPPGPLGVAAERRPFTSPAVRSSIPRRSDLDPPYQVPEQLVLDHLRKIHP